LVKGVNREDWNFLVCDGQLRGNVLEKCSFLALEKFVKAVTATPLNFGEYFYISSLQFSGIMANYNHPEAAFRASFPTSQLLMVSFDFSFFFRLTLFIKMDPSKVKLVVFGIDKPLHFIVAFLLPQENRLFLFDSIWREEDPSPNEDEVINDLLQLLCFYTLRRSKAYYVSGDKFVASTVMLRRMKSP